MSPLAKLCPHCRRIHTGTGTRHPECQLAHDHDRNAARRHGGHTDPAWQRHSRTLLRAWRLEHGDWCPGDTHHPPHQTPDLTVNHPHPLTAGGSLLEQDCQVICRSANSRQGGRVEGQP